MITCHRFVSVEFTEWNRLFCFLTVFIQLQRLQTKIDRSVKRPKLFSQEQSSTQGGNFRTQKTCHVISPFLLNCDKTFSLRKQQNRMIYWQRYPTLPNMIYNHHFFLSTPPHVLAVLLPQRKTIKNFNLSLVVRNAFMNRMKKVKIGSIANEKPVVGNLCWALITFVCVSTFITYTKIFRH